MTKTKNFVCLFGTHDSHKRENAYKGQGTKICSTDSYIHEQREVEVLVFCKLILLSECGNFLSFTCLHGLKNQ